LPEIHKAMISSTPDKVKDESGLCGVDDSALTMLKDGGVCGCRSKLL
jgi:hypothetical protein